MKKTVYHIIFLCMGLVFFTGKSQTTATKKKVIITGVSVIDPTARPSSFAPLLKNLEAPIPGGNSSKSYILSQKIATAVQFPAKNERSGGIEFGSAPDPQVISQMSMRKYIGPIDREDIYNGGTPLDNTMALSKDHLLASVNSFLWAYDVTGDSNLFVDDRGSSYNVSFAEFGIDYITDPAIEFPFDPKLLYIPEHDKFIFIFLSGREPSDSKIIVGFSSTNDPRDPWNVYMLPGNPRGVDQWTDFPMVGYDKNSMYLSINLLKSNTSWQLGFEGSIIWQVPLQEGFVGQSTLNTTMYDDILFNGTKIRNLTPVQPGDARSQSSLGITFLSNRNFDLQNDSLFIVEIDSNQNLSVSTKTLPEVYGMPPNGIQADDDSSDETDGLQTNDARFLGATQYYNSEGAKYIEFVGNTKDFNTGRSAIYHGIMHSLGDHSHMESQIIGVDSLDFGYPNIEYVNNGQGCYEGTLIAFNHTSFSTNAGISAIRHSNIADESGYSNIIRLKEGDGHVTRINGSYERWGDYFGIQSVPGHPNQVYTAGFYGTDINSSSTWFNKISVTDEVQLLATTTTESAPYILSSTVATVEPSLGYEPYQIIWSNGDTEFTTTFNAFENSQNTVQVTDAKGCVITEDVTLPSVTNRSSSKLYPNPVSDEVNVTFEVNATTAGNFGIYDMAGKLIVSLGDLQIMEGANSFTFSARPLLKGAYVLIIKDGADNNIIQQSFIKL